MSTYEENKEAVDNEIDRQIVAYLGSAYHKSADSPTFPSSEQTVSGCCGSRANIPEGIGDLYGFGVSTEVKDRTISGKTRIYEGNHARAEVQDLSEIVGRPFQVVYLIQTEFGVHYVDKRAP